MSTKADCILDLITSSKISTKTINYHLLLPLLHHDASSSRIEAARSVYALPAVRNRNRARELVRLSTWLDRQIRGLRAPHLGLYVSIWFT